MTIEKMLAGQRSARNHIIVEVMRDYAYVDARGMGVRTKVVPALKAGGSESSFDATEDYVKAVVGKMSVKKDVILGEKGGLDVSCVGKESVKSSGSVGKTATNILSAIRKNRMITIPELANLVGITSRSVERNLRKLQTDGALRRVGGRKVGHWEVAE